jgi:hypothetical protein
MASEPDRIERRNERRALLTLGALSGGLVAGGILLFGDLASTSAPDIALGDLSQAQVVEIRDDRGQTVLSGEFRERTDPLGNVEKDAALADARGQQVIGEVEVEINARESEPHQELEVDIIKLAPAARFTVVIDDRAVATFTTDDRGSVDFEMESPVTPF